MESSGDRGFIVSLWDSQFPSHGAKKWRENGGRVSREDHSGGRSFATSGGSPSFDGTVPVVDVAA